MQASGRRCRRCSDSCVTKLDISLTAILYKLSVFMFGLTLVQSFRHILSYDFFYDFCLLPPHNFAMTSYFHFFNGRSTPHWALASSIVRLQISLSAASLLYSLIFSSNKESLLMLPSHPKHILPTGLTPWNLPSSTFWYSRIIYSD